MQGQIIHETFFEGRKRAEVAQRLGISVHTYDNHLQAAFRSLRDQLTQDADVLTTMDRSPWFDLIEEMHERYEAGRLRRASAKTGKRSHVKGERSNIAGDGSNSERDRGKNARAGAAQVGFATKS